MRKTILSFAISVLIMGNGMDQVTAKEEEYSKEDVLSFANTLFEGKGSNFGRWNTPIVYKVVGLSDPEHVKTFSSVMQYYSALTGIEVVPHEEGKINFLVILVKGYAEAAYNPEIQDIFKRSNETVDDFINRISRADDNPEESTEFAIRHLDDHGKTVGYYVLDNPSGRKSHVRNYFLELGSRLFLEYNPNNLIVPSIFNAMAPVGGYWSNPVKRLPRLDELLIQEIYQIEGAKITDTGYRRFIENTTRRIEE